MGGGVGGGRGVGGGGVVGSGLVGGLGLGLVDGVLGLTLVPHISDVARVAIGDRVSDNLGAAVGKGNTVLAVGGIAVTVLILVEVGAGVVVLDSVLVVVHRGSVLILGSVVGGGGLVVSRGGGGVVGGGPVGNSHGGKGKNNEGLEFKKH